MDLYEYQGKQFFATYGIPVSPGEAVSHRGRRRRRRRAHRLPVVVKAQVQVGGRGKAGGIKLANDADEVRTHAGEHPRHGHQGPHRRDRLDRARLRHRRGVLRQLHPRPLRQEAPRDALGPGRRGDRGGRRGGPRRHRQDLDRPGRRPHRGGRSGLGGGGQAQPRRHRGHRRHPPQALHGLHRGRRRPRRDQPADPQAHRRGARPRRQGEPRRQQRVPPPRLRAVRRHPGARRAREGGARQGPPVRRASRATSA